VVSDSGTLPEESSFFTSVGHSFPAVCIRTSTERPEALDKGCFVLAGIDEKSLLQAVENPALQFIREELSLNRRSRVLVISTEGDTDRENYRAIVWDGKYPSPQ